MNPSGSTTAPPGDHALVAGLLGRDPDAVAALYDRYSRVVLALALRILKERAEAEEVLGDVFWDVWSRPERFDATRGSFSTFVITLTRSRAIDRLRARRRGDRVAGVPLERDPAEAAAQPTPATSPFEGAVQAERRGRINRALEDLSAEQRRAIELAYYDGMSHSEIADELKEPLGTVKGRIRTGLIRLRGSLRNVYGGEESR